MGALPQILTANAVSLGFQISTAIQSISSPNPNSFTNPQSGVYRPAGWSKPALTSITVPANPQTSSAASSANMSANPTIYVFDAVMRLDHTSRLQITEHPVQSQASISDHAYRLPWVVTLMVEMSGAMDSYTPGQWTGSGLSKGINAHALLLQLQESRTFVTLTTRLKTYQNMLVESVSPIDDSTTLYGLRAPVVFREVFIATVTAVGSTLIFDGTSNDNTSARAQTTQDSPIGTVQPTTPTQAVVDRNSVNTSIPGNGSGGVTGGGTGGIGVGGGPGTGTGGAVPGAGDWSSNAAILTGTITKSATP